MVVLSELQEAIYEDTKLLDIPKKMRVNRDTKDLKSKNEILSSRPKKEKELYVNESDKNWKPPTISSVILDIPSSLSSRSNDESLSSDSKNESPQSKRNRKSSILENIDEEILDLQKRQQTKSDASSEVVKK
ncbi:hypothetical protein NPIL_249621 [Nephila pilipes]|uniref:Uncharacterized protein n=1 Tax=Nephila pilipes TaxID=299642 RepID=A0A8X6N3U0_NEPPI|nr:hypothetical protein NPIL_249621 [Nephila pilipes]